MKWWLWGKSNIGAIDPGRPVTGLIDQVSKVKYFGYTEHTLAMDAYPFEIPRSNRYDEAGAGGDPLAVENFLNTAYESEAQSAWVMLWAAGHLWSRGFYGRRPTGEELRLMSYASIACGARGLFYFALRGIIPTDSSKQEQLFGIFNEMVQPQDPFSREAIRLGEIFPVFGPLLVGAEFQGKEGIGVEAKNIETVWPNKKALGYGLYSGKDYELLVVYNRDAVKQQRGALLLKPGRLLGREVFDMAECAVVPVSEGRLSLALSPGDGRFFLIGSKEVQARVLRECDARKYFAEKRRFDFLKPEAAAYGIQPGREEAESEALLAKDPKAAWEKKVLARKDLLARLQRNEGYQKTRGALDEAGAIYSALNERYRHYLFAQGPTLKIPGDPDLKRFTIQLVKLTDSYVLLRNGLYAGKGKELAGTAAALKKAVGFLEERSRSGEFKGMEGSEVDAVFSEARSCLGLAERILQN